MKLLVASRSAHKVGEIRRILAAVPGLVVLDLDDAGVPYDPAEEGLEPYETFEENAESKARHFHGRSGLATVADDSGLTVDALGGEPGVRSKRFAPGGEGVSGMERDARNNRYLLERLEGVPKAGRGARYVCVAALVTGSGPTKLLRGEAAGRILTAPSGSGGFGYDPLFFDEELGRTFADLSPREKNERSHRGTAFRALAEHLRSGAWSASP